MRKLKAKQLLKFSTKELWDILTGKFILIFDDNIEIITTAQQTIFSSYFWIFHRLYPEFQLLSKYFYINITEGELNSKTHKIFLEYVYWDCIKNVCANLVTPLQREHLTKLMYDVITEIRNDSIHKCSKYPVSLDILDFIEIATEPEIKQACDNFKIKPENIKDVYDLTTKKLKDKNLFKNNPIAKAVQAGTVNLNQTLQCVNPVGYVANIDNTIIPTPIISSYLEGLNTPFEYTADSRKAVKALHESDANIADTEYTSRRLQHIDMAVKRIEYVDCGSTNYINWRLRPPSDEQGYEWKGDLIYMEGIYYLNEETNTLKILTLNDTHLYNKNIKIRNVLTCQLSDHQAVCSVCFGKLADNHIPYGNIGHNCTAYLYQIISQSVISTKHLQTSAETIKITLNEEMAKYFTVGKDEAIYIKNRKEYTNIKLYISQDQLSGITDIYLTRVQDLQIHRLMKITYVQLAISKNNTTSIIDAEIMQHGRPGIFTYEFLEFIKQKPLKSENLDFVIDLDGWDFSKPVINIIKTVYTPHMHSKDIASAIESVTDEMSNRLDANAPAKLLLELFELVNSRLNINISILSTIIYGFTIRNSEPGDYMLGRGSHTAGLGISASIISHSSLGVMMCNQYHKKNLFKPVVYFPKNKPDSDFDVFLKPREVIENERNSI